MGTLIDDLRAFIAAVKDDPFLSELFRVAANELHAKLDPAQEAHTEPPAQVEQAPPAPAPAEGTPPPPVPPADPIVPPTGG